MKSEIGYIQFLAIMNSGEIDITTKEPQVLMEIIKTDNEKKQYLDIRKLSYILNNFSNIYSEETKTKKKL